jgi:hypothetical protein
MPEPATDTWWELNGGQPAGSACSLAAQASAGWSSVFAREVIGRDQLEL